MNERMKEVAWANDRLKEAYQKLREGKFEDQQLYEFITRAIDDLKEDATCGDRLAKRI